MTTSTEWNNQVPQFISPFPDQKALHTDAFSLNWDLLERPYLFPPLTTIPQCLERMQSSMNMFLAVLQCWQNRPWFPDLLNLLIDYLIRIPVTADLLTQGLGQGRAKRHLYPDSLKLAGRILSGGHSLRGDFLRKLHREQPIHRGNPQLPTTKEFGKKLWAG
jgi:hypothetical protein